MSESASRGRSILGGIGAVAGRGYRALYASLRTTVGGTERLRVVVLLACVLGLSGADVATVGASATALRSALGISNTQIGLLIAVSSVVGAVASIPFGVLADRSPRTRVLGGVIALWGGAMIWSAAASNFSALLVARLFLGAVTAAAGPMVASLVGDYFRANERGRIYGFVLAGELLGAGFGFAVTGDIATLSWRAAFLVLAIPAFLLAWAVFRLPEPARGAAEPLPLEVPNRGAPEPEPGSGPTDAQRLASERGVGAAGDQVVDAENMNLIAATRHVLRVRTNVILIAASACGYYFLAGVQTFGIEFVHQQYGIDQALANGLLLLVGVGAVLGVLVGGAVGDRLIRWRILNGRILTAAVAATATTILFAPALFAGHAFGAVPYLIGAAFALSAQNPPLDAARLDIMPSALWGRAEAIRTLLRSLAIAAAPLVFGASSDYIFGGGRVGLQRTFVVMLLPLAASAVLLFRALRTYPLDVAAAAASDARRRCVQS